MRRTITLDPDVYRLLKTAARKQGKTLRAVLNDAVRHSLGHEKKTFARGSAKNKRISLKKMFDKKTPSS